MPLGREISRRKAKIRLSLCVFVDHLNFGLALVNFKLCAHKAAKTQRKTINCTQNTQVKTDYAVEKGMRMENIIPRENQRFCC